MDLKQLTFGHIEGFSDLSREQQDEFIALFKNYVTNRDPTGKRKNYISESKITDVRVTRNYNYCVSFCDQSDIVLKPVKRKSIPSKKRKTPTAQVRMSVYMHQEMKKIAEQENRDMREIIDTACKQYMERNYY